MSEADRVWLNGEQFDVAYQLDLGSNRVRRFHTKGSRIGEAGGACRRVRGGWIAYFVSPGDHTLQLWAAGKFLPLDGSVAMQHRVRCAGLWSRLVIDGDGGRPLRIVSFTPARAVLCRIDPAYDSLDESMDDFLADIADIARSAERRSWILARRDPTAGPWHLVAEAP